MPKSPRELGSTALSEVVGPHKPTLSYLKLKQIVSTDESTIYADQTIMLTADEA